MNVMGVDLYNQVMTGDKAATLQAFSCMTATRGGPHILIDKCSNRKDDIFPTLTMNERQISMMISEDLSNTIAATDYKGSQVVCYEEKDE